MWMTNCGLVIGGVYLLVIAFFAYALWTAEPDPHDDDAWPMSLP